MRLTSKKIAFLILGITALACARLLFWFFNDPEGPNLLVVMGMAAIVYVLSLAIYLSNSFLRFTGGKRISFAIFIQILIVTGFYFGLK